MGEPTPILLKCLLPMLLKGLLRWPCLGIILARNNTTTSLVRGAYGPGANQFTGHRLLALVHSILQSSPTCIHHRRTLHRLSMPLLLLLDRSTANDTSPIPSEVLLVPNLFVYHLLRPN
jgi:hypothetical protein